MALARIHIVIPAFRESKRIGAFLSELCQELDALDNVTLQVVDDGSGEPETQKVREIVDRQRDKSKCLLPLLELPKNLGKGGAIYAGWKAAPEVDILGFVDADGSCSANEVKRLSEIARQDPSRAVFASRLKILGRNVDRKFLRHLVGRVYATFTSMLLDIPIYDSQCGLKFVPASGYHENAEHLQSVGFAFDAELLTVLVDSGYEVIEQPIDWSEIPGGTVSMIRDPIRMFFQLLDIRRRRKARLASK